MRTLIKGGCVVSMHPKIGNHDEADVLIEDGIIAEVGHGLRARDAEVIDARDAIVMPGFIDSHRHVWESLFRGLGDVAGDVAGDPTTSYAPRFTADDVYAATLIGLLGAAEAGITTVVDWCELSAEADRASAALEAHADAGLRTVFVHADATWASDAESWRSGLRRLAAAGAAPLATLAAGPREPRSGELDRLSSDWNLARELELRIHTHAGRHDPDGGLAAGMAGGLLAADVTLVHCSGLDDASLDSIASSGASVSLTPASEMAGGRVSLPVQNLIDRGIRPGLGIDSERLVPGDMFAQMRAVISLQHATYFESKLAGKAGLPRLLTTREVIRYGTVDGARAVGLGEVTGSLEPGKQADIIVLRTDRPNIFPINDPIGAIVWGMDTSNIEWVLVAGRPVMRHGELQVDLDRARTLAATAQHRVAGGTGLPAGTSVGGQG